MRPTDTLGPAAGRRGRSRVEREAPVAVAAAGTGSACLQGLLESHSHPLGVHARHQPAQPNRVVAPPLGGTSNGLAYGSMDQRCTRERAAEKTVLFTVLSSLIVTPRRD